MGRMLLHDVARRDNGARRAKSIRCCPRVITRRWHAARQRPSIASTVASPVFLLRIIHLDMQNSIGTIAESGFHVARFEPLIELWIPKHYSRL